MKTVLHLLVSGMIGLVSAPPIACASSWCPHSSVTPPEHYTIVGRGDTLAAVEQNIESIIAHSKIDSLLSRGIMPPGDGANSRR